MGYWAQGDDNACVRIALCGEALCAINTWIKDDKKTAFSRRWFARQSVEHACRDKE